MIIEHRWCERGYSQVRHNSKYIVDPWATKTYHYLKQLYCWEYIKKDISNFTSSCLACEHVKDEYRQPVGLPLQCEIPECESERVNIECMTELPRNLGGYGPVWIIVDRLTKPAHSLLFKTRWMEKQLQEYTWTKSLDLTSSSTYHI